MKTMLSIFTFILVFQSSFASLGEVDSAKPLSSDRKTEQLHNATPGDRKPLRSFEGVEDAAAWTVDELVSGNWIAERNFGTYQNVESMSLQFQENGSVDIFITDVFENTTHSNQWWTVSTVRNQVYLIFDDLTENEMYRVTPTKEGLTMEDIVSGETVFIEYSSRKTGEELNAMKNQLYGQWASTKYPFELTKSMDGCGTFVEMKNASFSMTFAEDGTFERSLSNKMVSVDEQGVWELSRDGKFLTLYFTKNDDPETVYGKTVVELKLLGQQNLWMKQSIETAAFQSLFCTPNQLFTMEKVQSDPASDVVH